MVQELAHENALSKMQSFCSNIFISFVVLLVIGNEGSESTAKQ